MNKKPDWWIGSLTIIYGIYMFTVGLKTANQYNGAILVIGGMIIAAVGVSLLAFLDKDVIPEPKEKDEDDETCLECLERPTYVIVNDCLPNFVSLDYSCEKHKPDGAVKIDYLEELSGDLFCPNCGYAMCCECDFCTDYRQTHEVDHVLPWVVYEKEDAIACSHCGMKHHIDWWERLAVECAFSEKM